jgi:3-deoxy-D-manno-octulosonic-acid transferase
VRYVYSGLIHLLRPVAFAAVLCRGFRDRRYWTGLGERFGLGYAPSASGTIWVHAVSLGEVTAAAPLIRALRARHPQIPMVLTTATLTGRARAQALFGDSVAVRFLPYDTPGSMRRFMGRVGPRLAIIIETELWPNLFNECRRRGIPVVLASARLSLKSVALYRRFGGLFRGVFSSNTQVAAQSADDAARFIAIGADPVRTYVIGNIKFDPAIDAADIDRGLEWREICWATRPVWIAGSTHADEEEAALTAHGQLIAGFADALLLLVPRHPERFQAVAELLMRRGIRFERRSGAVGGEGGEGGGEGVGGEGGGEGVGGEGGGEGDGGTARTAHTARAAKAVRADTQVLLVDTVGELAALYASVDVAFVGGSLVPVGGHNLLEPAALGVPVLMGPYQSNVTEIAQLLLHEGGALQVRDASQLGAVLRELFSDPQRRRRIGACAKRVVDMNRGSVARLLELIEPLLSV